MPVFQFSVSLLHIFLLNYVNTNLNTLLLPTVGSQTYSFTPENITSVQNRLRCHGAVKLGHACSDLPHPVGGLFAHADPS